MGLFDALFGTTSFDNAEIDMHGAVLDEFGELFRHTAILPPRPNYSERMPDPACPPYVLRAVFSAEHHEVRLGSEQSGVSTRRPEIELRKCDLRTPVRKLHQFTRLATGETFEATDVQRDSLSGVAVPLVQCGVERG